MSSGSRRLMRDTVSPTLPAIFLSRGCLRESFMAGIEPKNHKLKVFISYARKDIVFADKLEAALKADGIETFIDKSQISAFEDWWKRIQALIAQADTVIFILSPDAIDSEVCQKEVAFAASLNKRFAPIVFRRVDVK